MLHPLLLCSLAVLAFMSCVFCVAHWKQNNGIADVAWGLGIALAAWLSFFVYGGSELFGHRLIVMILISVWALRLSTHVLIRNWGKVEDARYAAWRKEWGKWATLRSYFQVFVLQGLLQVVVALPLIIMNTSLERLAQFELIDFFLQYYPLWLGVGVLVWFIGFFFESVGDWQLLQFIKTKKKGQIMTSGLWAYTRHPNYFGEVTQWWAIGLLTLPFSWFALLGPALVTYLILFLSGIPMTERRFEGRPGWAEYKKRTSAFFPWISR